MSKTDNSVEIDVVLGDRAVRSIMQWRDLIEGADPMKLKAAVHLLLVTLFQEKIQPQILRGEAETEQFEKILEFVNSDLMIRARFDEWMAKHG